MTTRKNLYYYPNANRRQSPNPYSRRLVQGLSKGFGILNDATGTNIGIFDIYRNLPRSNILVCSWLENVPDRKGGFIQGLLVLLLLRLKNLLGVKLVWIMHNKLSHQKTNQEQKMRLFRALLKHADLILTHARVGIGYAHELEPSTNGKVCFIHHPVASGEPHYVEPEAIQSDVLVWGAMQPYKGILEFLKCLDARPRPVRFKTLFWGRFSSDDYYEECRRFAGGNVELRNEFISNDDFAAAQCATRVILFPYRAASILSSGALMDSLLASPALILGPNTGAFRDLAEEGCIAVYHDWDDAIDIIERHIAQPIDMKLMLEKRAEFCRENTWERAGEKINRLLSEL